MCGIFGYYSFLGTEISKTQVQDMGNIISYRGPDGQGIYFGDGVALGNQRLAIIDIASGNQPFYSDDQSVVVVQNGEIFNHIELAKDLEGTEFECKTHSDTEVILRLYLKYGQDFIYMLNGMFAISIFDKNLGKVFLYRDRVGEKPLYFFQSNEMLIFGSEIKSILAAGVPRKLDLKALDTYLSYNYVVPPFTLFQDIKHVMPGTYLEIDKSGIVTHDWWQISDNVDKNVSESDWVEKFNTTLDDAVRIRLRADVPFGAFLSGGVDSSTVVGLMSKHVKTPVQTFSIGFDDPKYDESPYAAQAASRFSTDHYCEIVKPNLLSLWDQAVYHCDQPHGDVSFMPTLKVAQLASKHVKMVLTGDGADELFGGYDKYKTLLSYEPMSDEEFEKRYIESVTLFNKSTKDYLYKDTIKEELKNFSSSEIFINLLNKHEGFDRINKVLFVDTSLLLSGNNLVKPDRMGMAVSIENRAPFLDFRVIELAFSMPGDIKIKENETKYIYKKAVEGLIGTELAYRKKQMFTVPIGEWLKTDLKNMVCELLLSETFKNRNLFDSQFVSKMYAEHCAGSANYTREIRALMSLEIWFRQFMPDYRYGF
ncbi:MAG: asparagine synthase (glutamine-hydrolyzing) [Bacteroidetes bacterium]|nr:asparagine synthase (glutamine-hydrolyzing) [Bacteroidota bacterium]